MLGGTNVDTYKCTNVPDQFTTNVEHKIGHISSHKIGHLFFFSLFVPQVQKERKKKHTINSEFT